MSVELDEVMERDNSSASRQESCLQWFQAKEIRKIIIVWKLNKLIKNHTKTSDTHLRLGSHAEPWTQQCSLHTAVWENIHVSKDIYLNIYLLINVLI